MQATMQAQYEAPTMKPPQQQLALSNASSMQMANQRQGHYQPLALMGPQQQLPYTNHFNPVAQQDDYQVDQVTCSVCAGMYLIMRHQLHV